MNCLIFSINDDTIPKTRVVIAYWLIYCQEILFGLKNTIQRIHGAQMRQF